MTFQSGLCRFPQLRPEVANSKESKEPDSVGAGVDIGATSYEEEELDEDQIGVEFLGAFEEQDSLGHLGLIGREEMGEDNFHGVIVVRA